MSKMDDMRAMREARYAAANPRPGTAKAASKPATKAAPKTTPKAAKKQPPAPAQAVSAEGPSQTASEELCGHRNMSGRTCTREKGHAAKSHRYS